MKEKKRKPGRPKLPKGHVKAHIVPIRFKPDELKEIERAAKANQQTVSDWIRRGARMQRRSSLKHETENAILYVWREENAWAGRAHLKDEHRVIYFNAADEDSAKAEAVKLAAASEGAWEPVDLISQW